jgi:hypothetical protein
VGLIVSHRDESSAGTGTTDLDDAELVPSAAGPLELVDESLFFEGGATPITVCHWYSVTVIDR